MKSPPTPDPAPQCWGRGKLRFVVAKDETLRYHKNLFSPFPAGRGLGGMGEVERSNAIALLKFALDKTERMC